MEKLKILVTGSCGYLGSVLIGELVTKYPNYNIVAYDNLYYRQNCLVSYCHNQNFEFVYGDVRDTNKLLSFVKTADVVFPLAAIVGFPTCENKPELAKEVNYNQILTISKNLSKNQRIILPQTNSGYGSVAGEVCTEESPLRPISVYGKTKCHAEKALLDNTNGISLRLATVFGTSPRMRLDLLVNDFTYKAVKDKYIVLFEKHFKRNYVHIRDVVRCFIFMMDNYDKCNSNIYNVGLENSLNKEQLCHKIKEYTDFIIMESNHMEDPDKRNYVVSNEKIKQKGFTFNHSLDEGIKELLKAYKIIANLPSEYTNL